MLAMLLHLVVAGLHEISETEGFSHGTAFNIVSKDLNMNKVCASWILQLLIEKNLIEFKIPGNF